jgi:hypothetical protein
MREGATLEDNIRRLADELNKMAAFYQSRHPESTLNRATPLLLTGPLAAEPTTRALLQSEIEYPVESLAPQLEHPPELPVAEYMINLGLALKKIPPEGGAVPFHDISINLLSGKYRKTRAKPVRAGRLVLWVILVGVLGLLYPLYQGLSQLKEENAGQEIDLSNITREYNLAMLTNEESALTDNAIRRITAGAAALENTNLSLLASRGIFTLDLQLVVDVLPPATYLTSIEVDRELVTVYGETDNVFRVVDYATALEGIEAFTGVRIMELDEKISFLPGDNATQNEPISLRRIIFGISIDKRE